MEVERLQQRQSQPWRAWKGQGRVLSIVATSQCLVDNPDPSKPKVPLRTASHIGGITSAPVMTDTVIATALRMGDDDRQGPSTHSAAGFADRGRVWSVIKYNFAGLALFGWLKHGTANTLHLAGMVLRRSGHCRGHGPYLGPLLTFLFRSIVRKIRRDRVFYAALF